jgi:osmoprotectant transport system permease protein
VGTQIGDAVSALATSYFGSVLDWLGDGANWRGTEGIPHRFVEHIQISLVSLVFAILISVPIGLFFGHLRKGGFVVVNIANLGRAIPSFSILLLAVLLWGIGNPPRLLTSIGIVSFPAFLALVALAIPPVLTNTYVGVSEVDDDVRDAARGMGMNDRQVVQRVEFPLATPFIMAGIRTSGVAVVATATLLAYVGGGGLGRFIIDGAAIDYQDPRIFAGALFVAVLSVITELSLASVQRLVVPRALRHVEIEVDRTPLSPPAMPL